MARRSRGPLLSFAITSVLAAAQLGASCVDGVTPDCSDAAACGATDLDASQDSSVIVVPDAASEASAADAADDVEAGDAADGG